MISCLGAIDLLTGVGSYSIWIIVTMPAMRSVVQRVRYAKVSVGGEIVASIAHGLCALVGVGTDDTPADVSYTATKLAGLRVFEDSAGKMNLNLQETAGEMLLISQFTLFGDVRRGHRPSFTQAAAPDAARQIFEDLAALLRSNLKCPLKTGIFRAHMDVELANDGPVTVLIDSRKGF
jgi:D-tyrosyl-tRNA(Tyr) deacylase